MSEQQSNPQVGILMGSASDWGTMKSTADTLEELGIAHEARVLSAHRTPPKRWSTPARRSRADWA